MPRYVILEHDHPFLHWDLMLEHGTVLRTWRLSAIPQEGVALAAEALGDHRPFYLDYEGPVSGDRGNVVRWDSGTFVVDSETPDELVVRLNGTKLKGTGSLRREADSRWQFTCEAPGAKQGKK